MNGVQMSMLKHNVERKLLRQRKLVLQDNRKKEEEEEEG
jgi:hypothetical protein